MAVESAADVGHDLTRYMVAMVLATVFVTGGGPSASTVAVAGNSMGSGRVARNYLAAEVVTGSSIGSASAPAME